MNARYIDLKEYSEQRLEAEKMRYILNSRYRFRGWYKLPTGIFDTNRKEAFFLDRER